MATFTEIHPDLIHMLLIGRGYSIMSLPGTKEVVYGKRRDAKRIIKVPSLPDYDGEPAATSVVVPLCIRVYTSMEPGGYQRENGADAIRVSLWTLGKNQKGEPVPVMLTGFKRVHRVEGWKRNLIDRLDKAEAYVVEACPKCGKPMRLRENKRTKEKFMGCVGYPDCNGVRNVSR